jgi:hypothetical protein
MRNARQNFALVWKRLVAALSLIAAALLAPGAPAPVGGAGAAGSRVGNGAAVASAATLVVAKVAGVAEGEQLRPPLAAPGDAPAKACVPRAWHDLTQPRTQVASPFRDAEAAPRAYAARSGPTRAPPAA